MRHWQRIIFTALIGVAAFLGNGLLHAQINNGRDSGQTRQNLNESLSEVVSLNNNQLAEQKVKPYTESMMLPVHLYYSNRSAPGRDAELKVWKNCPNSSCETYYYHFEMDYRHSYSFLFPHDPYITPFKLNDSMFYSGLGNFMEINDVAAQNIYAYGVSQGALKNQDPSVFTSVAEAAFYLDVNMKFYKLFLPEIWEQLWSDIVVIIHNNEVNKDGSPILEANMEYRTYGEGHMSISPPDIWMYFPLTVNDTYYRKQQTTLETIASLYSRGVIWELQGHRDNWRKTSKAAINLGVADAMMALVDCWDEAGQPSDRNLSSCSWTFGGEKFKSGLDWQRFEKPSTSYNPTSPTTTYCDALRDCYHWNTDTSSYTNKPEYSDQAQSTVYWRFLYALMEGLQACRPDTDECSTNRYASPWLPQGMTGLHDFEAATRIIGKTLPNAYAFMSHSDFRVALIDTVENLYGKDSVNYQQADLALQAIASFPAPELSFADGTPDHITLDSSEPAPTVTINIDDPYRYEGDQYEVSVYINSNEQKTQIITFTVAEYGEDKTQPLAVKIPVPWDLLEDKATAEVMVDVYDRFDDLNAHSVTHAITIDNYAALILLAPVVVEYDNLYGQYWVADVEINNIREGVDINELNITLQSAHASQLGFNVPGYPNSGVDNVGTSLVTFSTYAENEYPLAVDWYNPISCINDHSSTSTDWTRTVHCQVLWTTNHSACGTYSHGYYDEDALYYSLSVPITNNEVTEIYTIESPHEDFITAYDCEDPWVSDVKLNDQRLTQDTVTAVPSTNTKIVEFMAMDDVSVTYAQYAVRKIKNSALSDYIALEHTDVATTALPPGPTSDVQEYTSSGWGEGTFQIEISSDDWLNNYAMQTYYVALDSTPPAVSLDVSPSADSPISRETNVSVQINATDEESTPVSWTLDSWTRTDYSSFDCASQPDNSVCVSTFHKTADFSMPANTAATSVNATQDFRLATKGSTQIRVSVANAGGKVTTYVYPQAFDVGEQRAWEFVASDKDLTEGESTTLSWQVFGNKGTIVAKVNHIKSDGTKRQLCTESYAGSGKVIPPDTIYSGSCSVVIAPTCSGNLCKEDIQLEVTGYYPDASYKALDISVVKADDDDDGGGSCPSYSGSYTESWDASASYYAGGGVCPYSDDDANDIYVGSAERVSPIKGTINGYANVYYEDYDCFEVPVNEDMDVIVNSQANASASKYLGIDIWKDYSTSSSSLVTQRANAESTISASMAKDKFPNGYAVICVSNLISNGLCYTGMGDYTITLEPECQN